MRRKRLKRKPKRDGCTVNTFPQTAAFWRNAPQHSRRFQHLSGRNPMSRSGYNDDCDGWALIRWRGAVNSAIRGKRGQEFLYEMLHALHALPEHKLITEELEKDGAVCALGAVGKARGLAMDGLDPYDHETVAAKFDIPHALACEIMFWNDEYWRETPEARFTRMREWIEAALRDSSAHSE